MKNYVKPIVLVNEELAEGVYAASGVDCWTITPKSVQDWDGKSHVFEVKLVHSTEVQHISNQSTSEFTFNYNVSYAYCEAEGDLYQTTWSGNKVTVVRNLHANAYKSGDVVTFKLFVQAGDQATTTALSLTGYSVTDTGITENVQGLGGDGT